MKKIISILAMSFLLLTGGVLLSACGVKEYEISYSQDFVILKYNGFDVNNQTIKANEENVNLEVYVSNLIDASNLSVFQNGNQINLNFVDYEMEKVNTDYQKIGNIIFPSITENIKISFNNVEAKKVSFMFTLPETVSTEEIEIMKNWSLDVSDNLELNDWYNNQVQFMDLYQLATLSGTRTAEEINLGHLEKKYLFKTEATKLFSKGQSDIFELGLELKSEKEAGYYKTNSSSIDLVGVFEGVSLSGALKENKTNEYLDENYSISLSYKEGTRKDFALDFNGNSSRNLKLNNAFIINFSNVTTAEYSINETKNRAGKMIKFRTFGEEDNLYNVKVNENSVIEAVLDTSKGANYDDFELFLNGTLMEETSSSIGETNIVKTYTIKAGTTPISIVTEANFDKKYDIWGEDIYMLTFKGVNVENFIGITKVIAKSSIQYSYIDPIILSHQIDQENYNVINYFFEDNIYYYLADDTGNYKAGATFNSSSNVWIPDHKNPFVSISNGSTRIADVDIMSQLANSVNLVDNKYFWTINGIIFVVTSNSTTDKNSIENITVFLDNTISTNYEVSLYTK